MAKRNAGGRMTKARTQHESQNPERFKTAQETIPGARNLSNRQLSRSMGWDKADAPADPGAVNPRQGVLFEHPHQIDNPPQWEDMSPKKQQRTLAGAADFGSTPDSMKRAFTPQLQRGLMRDPEHTSFYEAEGTNATGELLPKARLTASAKETGTPVHVNSMANAITSPNMSFSHTTKEGRTSYPNDDTAKAAIRFSQAGMSGKDYVEGFTSKSKGGAGYPLQGYPKQIGQAIDAASAASAGATVREAWKPSSAPGTGGSDKTRPYHNALVSANTPEGNFLVSDVHTGHGGMAPHLDKSQGEDYLKIPGIHALHDHVARQVAEEHGLSRVSRAQSVQWNQKKFEDSRNVHTGARGVEAMQPNRNVNQQQHAEVPGQERLF
jgi:hypothetical protein